jgi:hypothetical protein
MMDDDPTHTLHSIPSVWGNEAADGPELLADFLVCGFSADGWRAYRDGNEESMLMWLEAWWRDHRCN